MLKKKNRFFCEASQLLGQAVESPSLKVFKTQVDITLSNLLSLTLLWAGN